MSTFWTNEKPDAAGRLAWVARRYWYLLPALFGGLVLLGGLVTQPGDQPRFEARALVVGSDLDFHADQLPRLAHAVFQGPEVASIAEGGNANPQTIERSELQVLEGTVGMWVVSRSEDPEDAAVTANALATALASQLNEPGVGEFTLQSQASIPDSPTGWLGWPAIVLVSLFTALTLYAGVVGLLALLRRPVVRGAEVATVTGVPYLGVAGLPGPGVPADPRFALGLRALTDQLFPGGTGQVAFVSDPSSDEDRQTLSALTAHALARRGRVGLAGPELPRNLEPSRSEQVVRLRPTDVRHLDGMPTVVDCQLEADEDLPDTLPGTLPLVVVVRQGAALGDVEGTVARLPRGSVRGLVMVQRRNPSRRKARRARSQHDAVRAAPPPERRAAGRR